MATPLEMEITVHGGFNAVYSVLHGISLLFGSGDFHVAVTMFLLLFFTTTALFSAMAFLWGEGRSPFSWTRPFLYSYLLYWSFVIPMGTIHLYDDVKNQYAKIDGIPLLIVSLAGFTNQIENVLGELLETAIKPPLSVDDLAWGDAFDLLTDAYSYHTSGFFSSVEDHRSRSLWMYINKCVDVEVSIGHIPVNALWHNNGWCSDVLAKADNPALYTIVYDPSWGSDTINCKDAWSGGKTDHGHSWPGLKELICDDSALWADVAANYCASKAWGDDSSTINRCKQILANSAKFCLFPSTPSSEFLFTNSFIARKMVDFVSQYSTSMDQARLAGILATQSRMTSMGVMAAEYVPLMREATFAIVLLVSPILVLLMNTPFVREAFKTLVGLFLFVAFWGVVDRGITALHFNLAYEMCQNLRNQGFGMGVLFDLPRVDTKMVTMLGYMRLTGATLAGVITYGALKVGGYFLAGVASFLARGAGSGASAAASHTTPEGRLAHYEQAAKAAAAFGAAANWRYTGGMFWDDVVKEMERVQMEKASKGELLGAGGAPGASSMVTNAPAVAQIGGLMKSVGGAGGLQNWLSAATSKYQAGWTDGLARGAELQGALEDVKRQFGFKNDLEAARHILANPEVSKRIGQDLGLLKEYTALKEAGVIDPNVGLRDYIARREAISGMLGGADVFAFAREAGETGLSSAQAAYAKSLFSWGKEMGHLNELMQRFKGKDLSQLTPQEMGEIGRTLGGVYGAFEHARTTAGGLGLDQSVFTRYQEGLNEATKFFANAAASYWLETGKLPDWIAEPLNKIASTPEGKRMLQKHLSNIEISSLTPEQASRVNKALAAKGLATRFKAGDAARLYLGYTGNPDHPFDVSLAKADTGATRNRLDTTHGARGISFENWHGFFVLDKDGYTVRGAKSFEYDPVTGRFAIRGAIVRDTYGNTYQADLIGKGRAVRNSAGNIVGLEVTNLKDLAVENFKRQHGVRMPEFDLTPEKALNLAHEPEKLAATLEKFKDNPLVRRAFVTEFANKLAQGLQAYGDLSYHEGVGKEQRKAISAQAGVLLSGQTGPTVETIGKIMPRALARLMKSLGFGGRTGLSWQNTHIDIQNEKADTSYRLVTAAIRRTLEDGYAFADKYGNDAPLENAALRIASAVKSYEEQAEKAVDQHEKLERQAGKTDLTGTTPTEYKTGGKVKVERLGESIDVRGIDGKKQIPWKAVPGDDLYKKNNE